MQLLVHFFSYIYINCMQFPNRKLLILNSSTEEILGHTGKDVKTIMLGPSTPMAPEAFKHLPVHMLAGTVPLEKEKVLKAIRHGTGTPVIHRFSRKSFWLSTI